ncbi:MAG TPA: phenylalanine--tRNA ligase subunit alpha, partial [Rhodoglobus sp.]|nr:phenylalanine--tRNA ligase subunit alpha [Rhodoglobus sp.]
MSEPTPITEAAVGEAADAALAAIASAATMTELRAARTAHAGEQSPIARFNASLKSVAPQDRAVFGKVIGQARQRVLAALTEREAELSVAEEAARLRDEAVDVTALPSRFRAGARHPLSLLMEQMSDVFVAMGWEVAEGPELENEWFNFDALNTDPDHPARSEQDTFYVDPTNRHLLLRTQTSPVQIRSLLDRPLPV